MKKLWSKLYKQCKNLLSIIGSIFWWIVPFALFLLATFLPKFIWSLSFFDYLEFLKILVWPVSTLIILFFFKKVITYLVLSVDSFNLFGAKGELKNVYDLIEEKVDEKFQQEKKQKEFDLEKNKLLKQLGDKDGVAREVIKLWQNSIEENKNLLEENKKLKEFLERKNQYSGNTPFSLGESELGTGNKVDDSLPGTPSKDKKDE